MRTYQLLVLWDNGHSREFFLDAESPGRAFGEVYVSFGDEPQSYVARPIGLYEEPFINRSNLAAELTAREIAVRQETLRIN